MYYNSLFKYFLFLLNVYNTNDVIINERKELEFIM